MAKLGRFAQVVLPLVIAGALVSAAGCSTGPEEEPEGVAGSAGTSAGSAAAGTGAGTAGSGGTSAGTSGNVGDPPEFTTQIEADHAGITYTGRIDFSDAKRPRYSAPGVYVKARFTGTAVSVKFDDQNNDNYFDVIVDPDTDQERSIKLEPRRDTTEYPALWGLEPGEHTVVFVKRTESSIGYVDFLGFGFDGEVLDAPAPLARKIQVIGDSITCGVGDDVPPAAERPPGTTFDSLCKEKEWGVPYHNAYKAFGAVSARRLNAEYQLVAVSGIGLTRTYTSVYDTRPLPEVYDSLFLEQMDSPEWDPQAYVPDVVLVALGTNDFSPGDDIETHPRMEVDVFVDAYIEFLDKLMSDDYYPDAEFFVLGSPMLGDGYPDPSYQYRTDLETAIAEVEAHYADLGKVHALPIAKTFNSGCSSHPSARDQNDIAENDVIPAVSAVMGW
jgi:lysophospholipase L1-like esterase